MRCIELLRLVALNINQNKFKSVMTSIGIVVGAATIVLVIGIGKGGQADVAEQFANLNAGAIDISYEYKGEEECGGGGFSFGNLGQMFGNMFGGMFGGGGGAEEFSGEASFGGSSSASGSFPGEMPEGDFAGGDFTPGEMPEGNFAGGDFTPGEMPEGDFAEGEFTPGEMPDDEEMGRESQEESEEDQGEEDKETENTEDDAESSVMEDRLNQEKIILSQNDVEDIQRFVTDIEGATISYSTYQ